MEAAEGRCFEGLFRERYSNSVSYSSNVIPAALSQQPVEQIAHTQFEAQAQSLGLLL